MVMADALTIDLHEQSPLKLRSEKPSAQRGVSCFRLTLLAALLSLSMLLVHDPRLAQLERVLFLVHRRSAQPLPDDAPPGGPRAAGLSAVLGLTPPARQAVLREEARRAVLREEALREEEEALSEEAVPLLQEGRPGGLEEEVAQVQTRPQPQGQLHGQLQQLAGLYAGRLASLEPQPVERRQPRSADLPVLHQTVRSLKLTTKQREWRVSWQRLGFQVRTADNAQARRDIERMASTIDFPSLLRVYDALETNVQRSDVWRYAILWLEGGIYADIDVVAHAPLAALVRSDRAVVFSESLAVFDYLPLALSRALSRAFLGLGLTDLVRLPQRRNCLMVAPARHALMLRTLQLVVAKFDAERHLAPQPEPTHTLELTGPGIFTDAIEALSVEAGGFAALGLRLVHRFEGMQLFQHIGTGSWKTHLDDDAKRGGLKPHECMLQWAVMLMQATGIVLYVVVCSHNRIRLSPLAFVRVLAKPSACGWQDGWRPTACGAARRCCEGLCEGLCHSARGLCHSARRLAAHALEGTRPARPSGAGSGEGSPAPSSASKERREKRDALFLSRCHRSGSVPAPLAEAAGEAPLHGGGACLEEV